jgi:hypothetical protein
MQCRALHPWLQRVPRARHARVAADTTTRRRDQVPRALADKVRAYYRYVLEREVAADEGDIIAGLSTSLRTQVRGAWPLAAARTPFAMPAALPPRCARMRTRMCKPHTVFDTCAAVKPPQHAGGDDAVPGGAGKGARFPQQAACLHHQPRHTAQAGVLCAGGRHRAAGRGRLGAVLRVSGRAGGEARRRGMAACAGTRQQARNGTPWVECVQARAAHATFVRWRTWQVRVYEVAAGSLLRCPTLKCSTAAKAGPPAQEGGVSLAAAIAAPDLASPLPRKGRRANAEPQWVLEDELTTQPFRCGSWRQLCLTQSMRMCSRPAPMCSRQLCTAWHAPTR